MNIHIKTILTLLATILVIAFIIYISLEFPQAVAMVLAIAGISGSIVVLYKAIYDIYTGEL